MKVLSIMFSLLIAIPSFACPDLAGTYKNCKNTSIKDSQSFAVTIEQKVEKEITVYKWVTENNGSFTIYTKDKEILSKGFGPGYLAYDSAATSSCKDNKVVTLEKGSIEGLGNYFIEQILTKEKGKLVLHHSRFNPKNVKEVTTTDIICN
jgi:hypothetical protein